jgi:PAS domain S-box-containing protein
MLHAHHTADDRSTHPGAEVDVAGRIVLETLPLFVLRVGPDCSPRWVSHAHPPLRPEDLLGIPLDRFAVEEDRPLLREAVAAACATGARKSLRLREARSDGTTRTYDCWVAPHPDGGDAVLVAVDVSAHVERDRALEEAQARRRFFCEATGIGLWEFRVPTGEVFWTEAMHTLTGLATPAGPSRYLASLVHPDDRASVAEDVQRILTAEETFRTRPHRIVRPDGAVRWVVASGRVERDAAGKPLRVFGGCYDVTAVREAEEARRRAHRVETLGRVAAGVAHNFNNLLAAIVPALELVLPHAPADVRPLVEDALGAALRGGELLRKLMTVGRPPGTWVGGSGRVADGVRAAVELARRVIDREVTLEVRDESGSARVALSADDLEQAVLNLVINARDAVLARGKSGTVQVAVEVVEPFDAGEPLPAPLDERPLVRIRVTDDGVGMAPEVMARVFEPFFSTKGPLAGSGLGLATVRAAVEAAGGTVTVRSVPFEGTTFAVYLPLLEGDAPSEPAPSSAVGAATSSVPPPGDREVVLVVDDEVGVRMGTARLLRRVGFLPLTASGVAEARKVLAEQARVDALLLDRSMPDGPGDTLVPEVRAGHPEAAVVFFSGQGVEGSDGSTVDAVLDKPATAGQIVAVLRTAIDRRRLLPVPVARGSGRPPGGAGARATRAAP